ncbi:MAG TPA: sigma factor-like helix-turn-helix DNA-binding protein [Gemmataceae bacterium]|nr:sigma factor-like helix-turn-helix DNA-binding protein [Gemmataceae bacterium]
MPRPQTDVEHLWRDVQPVVDEELHQLPDDYRAAVVLCYLEGKTNAEAAEVLGWPVGTVKSRLARARTLLRSRLARRGVTITPAVLGAALAGKAAIAVPAELVEATVRNAALVAAGRPTTTKAYLLAEGILKSMLVTRLKIATAVLLALGAFLLGVTVLV